MAQRVPKHPGRLPAPQGTHAFDQACALQIEAEDLLTGREFDVESPEVLDLVQRSNCSAYDCEFVALARRLETTLVTSDRKLLNAFPDCTAPL